MAEPKLYDLKTNLPLAAAEQIIDAALAAGRAEGMLLLTVVVLDAGGHPIALKRQDRSGILRVDIATGKAWGALGMGIPSRTINERLGQRLAFQGVLVLASDGQVIGAVGISGDTSDKDEYCAIQGIKAAGLIPAPAEPAKGWQGSGL